MFASILHLIVYSLMSLFLVIVILRFLLQLVRADFYNPLSQAIVKITMPLLKPLRRFIPSIASIDTASIVLILLVQFLATFILSLIVGVPGVITNPLMVIVWGFVGALTMVSGIFIVCLIISIIGSFIAPFSSHPLLTLANQIVEPIARPIRKVIPPLGGMLDISPIIIFISIKIINMLISHLAIFVGVDPRMVLGYW